MSKNFYDEPIINTPYKEPKCHYQSGDRGQPLDCPPIGERRESKYYPPVPKARKKKSQDDQSVMPMLIAWYVANAVGSPNSKKYSDGFLIVTWGLRFATVSACFCCVIPVIIMKRIDWCLTICCQSCNNPRLL